VGKVGAGLILEFHLVLAAHLRGKGTTIAVSMAQRFARVSCFAIEIALNEVVLHELVESSCRPIQHAAERFGSLTHRRVQVPQNQGGHSFRRWMQV
jgi:hypothetical protein